MFWKFVSAFVITSVIAAALVQLGALTVWVAVLSLALKSIVAVAIVVAISIVAIVAWRRGRRT